MSDVVIFTDGGCAINPGGMGACATVVTMDGARKETVSPVYRATTNNRMEIMGVILALKQVPEGRTVVVNTDSQYVSNTLTGKWRKNKNLDLWAKAQEEIDRLGGAVSFNWVRGHHGVTDNERCDELVTMALEKAAAHEIQTEIDVGYENSPDYSPLALLSHEKTVHDGIQADLSHIPSRANGKVPKASVDLDAFCREKDITIGCGKCILEFYRKGQRTFRAYRDLKTFGLDAHSSMSAYELKKWAGEDKVKAVKERIKDDKDIASCLRWHRRGLTLEDAIRKVLVDIEIRANMEKTNG